MHFQEFLDSCTQDKPSEISNNALLGIMGLLCAERNVGNLKNCTFRNDGAPVRRAKRRKSQEDSGTPMRRTTRRKSQKNCTFITCGTPVRRRTRRNFQQLHVQKVWDSCAHNKTSELSQIYTFIIVGTAVRGTTRRKPKQYTFNT